MTTTGPPHRQDPSCIELHPSLAAVTVFRDRAQLTYVASVSLPAGAHVLSIKGEKGWESVLQNTLQIHLEDAANQPVVMRGVRFKTQFTKEDLRGRVRELEKERDEVREQLNDLADMKAVDDAIENALKNVEEKLLVMGERGVGPDLRASTEPMAGFLSRSGSWLDMLHLITREKRKLGLSRLAFSEGNPKLEEKMREIEKQLREITGGRHQERRETSVEVMVFVDERDVNLKFAVSFVAMGVSWTPLYDIRVDPGQSMMDVTYYAQVRQSTSMDWSRVQVRLSTAVPHFSPAPPELKEWNISLDPPKSPMLPRRLALLSAPGNRGNGGSDEALAGPQAGLVERAIVSALSTPSTFQIVGLATVRSDNKPVKLTITTQTFPVKLVYHAVPKLNPWTYLIAQAKNTSSYVFLPGKANIFADNTFVGQSQLELVAAGAELTMSLGTDDALSVTRKKVKWAKSTSHSMLRNRRVLIDCIYEFAVKGSLKAEATLVVKDQCPVSSHKDIAVKLSEPSKKMLTEGMTADGSGCGMDSEGIVEWQLQLPTGPFTRVFRFAFQVEHNEDMDVVGLDEGDR